MYILALETSGPSGGIAVLKDGKFLGEVMLSSNETYSKILLDTIEWLFKRLRIGWSHIGAIAVSLGPGGFTGLRIGISTAKGLAFALGIPIIGVPSLDALAANMTHCDGIVCPVIMAKKDQVYLAVYQGQADGCIRRISDFQCMTPKEAVDILPSCGRIFILGDGAGLIDPKELSLPSRQIYFASTYLSHIRAGNIGLLAWRRFMRGSFDDIGALKPIYVRPSDAELNYKSLN